MPAGTDLVAWSPRLGASGDDRYDPGADILIAAGSDSYDANPSLDQINAASGMNQTIAEARRRIQTYIDTSGIPAFPAPPSLPAFVAAASKIKSSDFTGMQTSIDGIRSRDGAAAFSWTALPAGTKILRQNLLELRKALAVDHIRIWNNITDSGTVSPPNFLPRMVYQKAIYPPDTTGTSSVSSPGCFGQKENPSSVEYISARAALFFKLPSNLPAIASAKIEFQKQGPMSDIFGSGESFVAFTARLYKSNSYLGPADIGDWTGIDVLESTVLISDTTVETLQLSAAGVSSGNHTYLLAGANEVDDVAPADGTQEGIKVGVGRLLLYT